MSAPAGGDHNIWSDPTVWVAVAFALFIVLFVKYAWKPITGGLDNRSKQIRDELDEAVRLREEAQALLAEYKQKQTEMLAEAESVLEHAKEEGKAMKANAEKDLEASVKRRSKMAKEKIARAEADAVAKVQSNMADIAVNAARAIITEQLQDGANEELIDQSTKDLDRIIH